MKIDHITLENFGVYAHKSFRFESAPLVLIFGANESGKTTALHGLRQALFGFRQRGSYFMGRPMSASIAGQMADGQALEFKRKKGRPDDVSGTLAGRSVTGEDVARLLCNIDLGSYEQLFGFSLDELRDGEAMLKNSRLSDALAGGGLGGMQSLQQLRGELQQSLSDLYKARGRNSTINVKLTELQRTQELLREHQVLPTEVEDLQRTLTETRDRSLSAKGEHRRLAERRLTIERLLNALPKYYELQATRHQLDDLEVPEGIDSVFAAQWSEYARQRQLLATRLDEVRQQLQRDKHLLSQLAGSQETSTFEQEIELVGHQAAEIPALRKRLQELDREQRTTHTVCQQLLEQLEMDAFSESLRGFVVPPRHRKELCDLGEQHVALGRDRIALQARLEEARDALQGVEMGGDVGDFVPDNLAELQTLVQQLDRAELEFRTKARDLQVSIDDREMALQHERVCKCLRPGAVPDVGWRTPPVEHIESLRQQLDFQSTEHRELLRAVDQTTKEVTALQMQLSQIDRGGSAELLTSQQTLRLTRDEILRQWLDDLDQPLLAASISPHDQRERLLELQRLAAAADELQGEILASAEAIAAVSQLELQIARALDEREQQHQRCAESERERTALVAKWHDMWRALPVEPAEPTAMLEWLQAFTAWCEKSSQVDRLRREAHWLRSSVRAQRVALLDAWPFSLREETSCEVLFAQLRHWESLQRDRLRDQQRVQVATANLEKLTQQLTQLDAAQEQLLGRYGKWLSQAPIPIDWPLEQVEKLLDTIEQLRRETTAHEQVSRQIEECSVQLISFTERTKQLAAQLGESLDSDRPEGAASRWLLQLQEMRKQKTHRIELTAAISHNSAIVEETEKQLAQLDEQLAKLCSSVGSMDVAGVGSLVERVRRGEELRIRMSELSAALEPLAAGLPFEEYLELLQASNTAGLQVEMQELEEELHALDEARKEADQQVGSLCQRLEQLANNRLAQQQLQHLQHQRGELAELAEQWVIERIAQQLLTRAIERFAADHEPALLGYTRRFLSKLTGGRYTDIEHDPAVTSSFTIRSADQRALPPDQLSTGTREQLYLAIRMAFITHHNESHEPLPVIMDDCFVNFDDLRAKHALEAIADWDERLQTILLSCHWRVVQILAEIAPETPAIYLDRDTLSTVGELASMQTTLLVP